MRIYFLLSLLASYMVLSHTKSTVYWHFVGYRTHVAECVGDRCGVILDQAYYWDNGMSKLCSNFRCHSVLKVCQVFHNENWPRTLVAFICKIDTRSTFVLNPINMRECIGCSIYSIQFPGEPYLRIGLPRCVLFVPETYWSLHNTNVLWKYNIAIYSGCTLQIAWTLNSVCVVEHCKTLHVLYVFYTLQTIV